jgi:hypothetical protein
MIEVLEGVEEFATIFQLYNSDPNDDPGLPGSAPGSGFPVIGLRPVADDPDGLVGEILFPTGAAANQLVENPGEDDIWVPRDLNGDGDIDFGDHSADYRLLPVLLRLRWEGSSGVRALQVQTLIADR